MKPETKKLGKTLGAAFLLGALGAGSALALNSTIAHADNAPNTNPHNGQQVKLFQVPDGQSSAVTKQCDGTTLVYLTPGYYNHAAGIAIWPNSSECK
jgi:hypothetical protein